MFFTGILLVIAVGLGIGVTISTVGLISYYFRELALVSAQNAYKPLLIQIIEFSGPIFIVILSLIMFTGLL